MIVYPCFDSGSKGSTISLWTSKIVWGSLHPNPRSEVPARRHMPMLEPQIRFESLPPPLED